MWFVKFAAANGVVERLIFGYVFGLGCNWFGFGSSYFLAHDMIIINSKHMPLIVITMHVC